MRFLTLAAIAALGLAACAEQDTADDNAAATADTASNFNEEFTLHGVASRIDPSIPMVHFICEAQFLHVSSSTAKELDAVGEGIGWLVTPCVEAAFAARRTLSEQSRI